MAHLPIHSPTQESADALVRAVHQAQVTLARFAAVETPLEAGIAFTNERRPGVPQANFAAELRVPEGRTAVEAADQVLTHFRARGLACYHLDAADVVWPADLAAALEGQDYRPHPWHVYRLQEYHAPAKLNEVLQVIPGRAAYEPLRQFYQAMAAAEHGADAAAAKDIADTLIDHLDEPRLDVFLGRLDGQCVGVAGVLILGQVGVLQQAYTDPAQRGKHIGGTLMAHLLEHCQRAALPQVIIPRHEGCPSIPFYESLGMARAASFVRYHRKA